MSEVIFSIFPNENFIDLGLYQFGWEKCDSSHSYGPSCRNHYLFHYILSGKGTLIAENEKNESISYSLKSGEGFLISPQQICTYTADSQEPWEYLWLEFDGLRVKEGLTVAGLSTSTPVYRPKYSEYSDVMAQEMQYIVDHKDASSLHLVGHLYLFFDALLSSVSAFSEKKENSLRDYYIKEAVSYIEQNYQNDITIEKLAAHCGLNRSYFGKIFHDHMGKSPQDFLITYRMSKAAELLKLTRLSISDIGISVGYPNQLHFSRAFKKTFGMSPRDWRNTHV